MKVRNPSNTAAPGTADWLFSGFLRVQWVFVDQLSRPLSRHIRAAAQGLRASLHSVGQISSRSPRLLTPFPRIFASRVERRADGGKTSTSIAKLDKLHWHLPQPLSDRRGVF